MSTGLYPWYKRWWGILIIAFIALVAMFSAYIGLQTLKFYRQIQLGDISTATQGRLTPANIALPDDLNTNLAYSDDDPSFGNPDAPLRIIEFADFECSFSKDAALAIRELQALYPDKIHYVYRDFPLEDVHPRAVAAALAANCANEQGKFWPMHDKIYNNQNRLTGVDLKMYAIETGLDITAFNKCFDSDKYKDEIEVDRADGIAAGVSGTPTFFINGQKVAGAIPIELWKQIVSMIK